MKKAERKANQENEVKTGDNQTVKIADLSSLEEKKKEAETKRNEEYENLTNVLIDLIDSEIAPITFDSDAMSPVNWAQSQITYFPRAYDSISVNASLHIKEEISQSINDFADGIEKEAAVKAQPGLFSAIEEAVSIGITTTSISTDSEDIHTARSVLVLVADKKVQQFETLYIDSHKNNKSMEL